MSVITEKLTNTVVKAAINALQKGKGKAWADLFVPDAIFYDDGNRRDLKIFSKSAIGHERFVSIDSVANNGLDIYGQFQSDQWGDFRTYFKFQVNQQGKITRLEIGQAD